MSHPGPEIIAYGYELAPNPQKLLQFLAFFHINYKYVEISPIMPRPGLAAVGITYRRAPLLSIGSDMYIDGALTLEKLSDLAQHTRDCGLADSTNHVEFDALGQIAFRCAVGLIPSTSPMFKNNALLADRTELLGVPFDPAAMAAARPQTISKLLSLLHLLQSHFLRDGQSFFLGGTMPSTADMHLYWGLNWGLRFHDGARPEVSETTHPIIFQWLDAVGAFIAKRGIETKISMEEAHKVLQVPPTHEYAKFVPHVADNPERLEEGQRIKVTPVDTGKTCPQFGELIGLNYEQVCLRNDKGLVMHFPRFGYEVEAA